MLGRRRDRPGVDDAPRRRTGPADEEPWWDPADQAFVESPLLRGRDFPKRWRPALMPNNVEVIDPFDGVSEADAVRRARQLRRITALDEGLAYRGRDGALAVLRAEMFADPDEVAHRAAWQSDGARVLTATYRTRWAEREVTPNFIETTVVGPGEAASIGDPRVDWLRVEDHTNPRGRATVTRYEHLTLWAGRAHVIVTLRHELGDEREQLAAHVGRAVLRRLANAPVGPPPAGP